MCAVMKAGKSDKILEKRPTFPFPFCLFASDPSANTPVRLSVYSNDENCNKPRTGSQSRMESEVSEKLDLLGHIAIHSRWGRNDQMGEESRTDMYRKTEIII